MIHPAGAKNQNVIKKHQYEAAEEWPKNLIHQRLKGCWGVGEAKGHDKELVEAIMSAERRLVDVCWRHSDLMIA